MGPGFLYTKRILVAWGGKALPATLPSGQRSKFNAHRGCKPPARQRETEENYENAVCISMV